MAIWSTPDMEMMACAFLPEALLPGPGTNYIWGFWQADAIAGPIIVVFLPREGRAAWQESSEEEYLDC
jgi:hypothetical protein